MKKISEKNALDNYFSKYHFKTLINVFFTNILILAIGVLFLELIFGSWVFSTNELFKLNIIVDKKLVYKLEGLYQSENDVINYSRDEHGLRGNYDKITDIDILTVGGSTTDQRYISDGLTWQDELQRCFKDKGKEIIVANAGVDGQSTRGHIKNFNVWFNSIPDLKPKYFLFFIGVNDFNIHYGSTNDSIEYINKFYKLKSKIKNNSISFFLYQYFKNIFSMYFTDLAHPVGHSSQNFSNIIWKKDPLTQNYENHFSNQLSEFEKRLEILCQKVQDYDAIPIFVTQSNRRLYKFVNDKVYGDSSFRKQHSGLIINAIDYYHIIRLFNNVTKKVSRMKKAVFIDLDTELEFNLENDFYDSCHHTPAGAKKIGEYLFEKLSFILM